jgi:hypothetical protein
VLHLETPRISDRQRISLCYLIDRYEQHMDEFPQWSNQPFVLILDKLKLELISSFDGILSPDQVAQDLIIIYINRFTRFFRQSIINL